MKQDLLPKTAKSSILLLFACGLGLPAVSGTAGAKELPAPKHLGAGRRSPRDSTKNRNPAWARTQFDALAEHSKERTARPKIDPDIYLRTLPWIAGEKGGHPVLPKIDFTNASTKQINTQAPMQVMLAHTIDSGVLFT